MSTRARVQLVFVVLAVAALLIAAVGRQAAGGGSGVLLRDEARRPVPTRHAAVLAATRFLTSMDLEVLLEDRRRDRLIDRFAAASARDALRGMYAAEKRRVMPSYQRRPRLARAALVGYRVDEFTPRQASVSIWAASIGGSGGFAPTAGWSTTTVVLMWDADRWTVADVRDEPGPSPDWPIATLASEAAGFKEYGHAP